MGASPWLPLLSQCVPPSALRPYTDTRQVESQLPLGSPATATSAWSLPGTRCSLSLMCARQAFTIALAVGLLAAPLDAKWRCYTSPHFELYSERTRAISETLLHQLELTRKLFSHLNGAPSEPPRITRIVAFRSEQSFKKTFPKAGAAYVLSGASDRRDYVAFYKPYYYSSYELIAHQYFHLQTSEPSLPTWLAEGLAEYYSTVYFRGGKARVGKPPQTIPRQGVGAWPALHQLFDAPDELFAHVEGRAEEGNPRFAKAWELVRMLHLDPSYKGGFQAFATALINGERTEAAFQKLYAKDLQRVEDELAAFARGPAEPGASYVIDWRASEYPIDRRVVDQDEADSMLAELSGELD